MNSQLAQKGLEIRARIDALTIELKAVNDQLIQEAGTDGDTASFPEGKVVISSQTADRPSGKYDQRFHREVFDELAENNPLRKKIMAAGIVTFEQGTIKGRSPVVQYRLNTSVAK